MICFLPGRGSVLMIFTITPLTNWGPIVLALTGGAESSLVADQFEKKGKKKFYIYQFDKLKMPQKYISNVTYTRNEAKGIKYCYCRYFFFKLNLGSRLFTEVTMSEKKICIHHILPLKSISYSIQLQLILESRILE